MLPDELLMYQNPSRVPEGQYTGAPIQPLPIVREAGNVLAGAFDSVFGAPIEYGGRAARAVGRGIGSVVGEVRQFPQDVGGAGLMDPQALAAEQERIRRMRERRVIGEVAQPLSQAGANIFGGLMDGAGMAARGVMGAIPTELPDMAPQQPRVEVVGGGGPDYKALRDQRMGQTESELSGIRMRDNLVRARRELAARNQNTDTTPLAPEFVAELAVEDKQRKAAERLMQDQERAQYMERLLPPEQQVYLSEMRQKEQAQMFLEARKMQTEERKAAAAEEFNRSRAEAQSSLAGKYDAQRNQIEQFTPEQIQVMRNRGGLLMEQAGLTAAKTRTEEVRPELMQAAQRLKEREFEEQKSVNDLAKKLTEAKTEREYAETKRALSDARNKVAQTVQLGKKLMSPTDSALTRDPLYNSGLDLQNRAARVLSRSKDKAQIRRAEEEMARGQGMMDEAKRRNTKLVFDPATGMATPLIVQDAVAPVGASGMPVAAGGPGSEYDDVMATFGIQF